MYDVCIYILYVVPHCYKGRCETAAVLICEVRNVLPTLQRKMDIHVDTCGWGRCCTPLLQVPVVVTEQERLHTERRTGEEVCGTKTFTEVEDRPIVKERVER